jgi:hypothetical protein
LRFSFLMLAMSETFELAHGDPRSRLMDELRRQVGRWEASAPHEEVTFSSGTTALDRLLAASPLRYGMLTEWLSGLARSGAATLSLLCAREACRPGGALVVIDRQQTFYSPAAAAWGIDLERLLIVRPRGIADELWAAEQALRSPAVAALWATINRLDGHAFRRLQLAAQAGRTLGLLLRPAYVRGQPSWADVRLEVSGKATENSEDEGLKMKDERWGKAATFHPSSFIVHPFCRRVQVRVLRMRGGLPGGAITLKIDDAAHTVREVTHDVLPLPVVPELADSTKAPRSARA